MSPISKDDIRYKEAEKRVKKIKNLYVFAFVYLAVNIFILIMNYRQLKPGETIWHLNTFLSLYSGESGLSAMRLTFSYRAPFWEETGKKRK